MYYVCILEARKFKITVVWKLLRYVIGNVLFIGYSHLLAVTFADALPQQIAKLLNLPRQFIAGGLALEFRTLVTFRRSHVKKFLF